MAGARAVRHATMAMKTASWGDPEYRTDDLVHLPEGTPINEQKKMMLLQQRRQMSPQTPEAAMVEANMGVEVNSVDYVRIPMHQIV